MTKEHVLRAWLGQQLGKAESRTTTSQVYRDPNSSELTAIDRIVPQSPYSTVVREVCKPCNEGWLNKEVEQPVGELLVTLAKSEASSVSALGSQQIALWSAKTAAVRGLMDKGIRSIPDAHYRWIMEKLLPPPFTTIWLAYCEAPHDTWTRHLRFSEYGPQGRITGHSTTIVLGELMLLVVGFSARPQFVMFEEFELILQLKYPNALQRIWPNPTEFGWPQEVKLSAKDVYQLSEAMFHYMGSLSN